MTKKIFNYLKFAGTIHSKTPITEEQHEQFVDQLVDLVESFDWNSAIHFSLKTDEDLEQEDKKEMELAKALHESTSEGEWP